MPGHLRKAGKICSALYHRGLNRLKSPDCVLCIFTCTFVYVLCFIFILAIVIRSSNIGGTGGIGQSLSTVQLTRVRQEPPAGGRVRDREDGGRGDGGGGAGIGGVSGGDAAVGGGAVVSDVLHERQFVEDILVEEAVFNDTAGVDGGGGASDAAIPPLDPEVQTDTSQFSGYGSQDFKYPMQIDMPDLLQRLRAGRTARVRAINRLDAPWFIGQADRCSSGAPVFLALLIKSHPANEANRAAIRSTWGRPDCWRRPVRIFFLLGADAAYGVRRGRRILRRLRDWRGALTRENARHGDLLVRDFVDHYYNNTLKLMSGVQWSVNECRGAKFTAFLDDDFFLNPYQVERQLNSLSPAVYGRFLGGWVWRTSLPRRRSRKFKSKWDISVSEYPWLTYPPYVAAGAMFMSEPVLNDIAVAMQYTKYLRFDDIFIGLVAHKLLLTPLHMEMVRAYDSVPANSTDTATLMRLVASHGYKRPSDIVSLWQRLHLFGMCSGGEPEQ